jgi:hypothetical protein
MGLSMSQENQLPRQFGCGKAGLNRKAFRGKAESLGRESELAARLLADILAVNSHAASCYG